MELKSSETLGLPDNSIFQAAKDPSEFAFLAAQGNMAANRGALLIIGAAIETVPKFARTGEIGMKLMQDTFGALERVGCVGQKLADVCDAPSTFGNGDKRYPAQRMAALSIAVAMHVLEVDEVAAAVAHNNDQQLEDLFLKGAKITEKKLMERFESSLPEPLKTLLKALAGDIKEVFASHGHSRSRAKTKASAAFGAAPSRRPPNSNRVVTARGGFGRLAVR